MPPLDLGSLSPILPHTSPSTLTPSSCNYMQNLPPKITLEIKPSYSLSIPVTLRLNPQNHCYSFRTMPPTHSVNVLLVVTHPCPGMVFTFPSSDLFFRSSYPMPGNGSYIPEHGVLPSPGSCSFPCPKMPLACSSMVFWIAQVHSERTVCTCPGMCSTSPSMADVLVHARECYLHSRAWRTEHSPSFLTQFKQYVHSVSPLLDHEIPQLELHHPNTCDINTSLLPSSYYQCAFKILLFYLTSRSFILCISICVVVYYFNYCFYIFLLFIHINWKPLTSFPPCSMSFLLISTFAYTLRSVRLFRSFC